jgi:hypothetical protein
MLYVYVLLLHQTLVSYHQHVLKIYELGVAFYSLHRTIHSEFRRRKILWIYTMYYTRFIMVSRTQGGSTEEVVT